MPSMPVAPVKYSQHGPDDYWLLSMTHLPCISGAWTASRQNGFAAPGYTGISGRPRAVRIEPVLVVVDSNEALPCTVLTPMRSRHG